MLSARRNSPNSQIILLTDDLTNEYIQKHPLKKLIYDLAHIVSVPCPPNFSAKERSRYLKTSMRHYVQGDILFIDCDTIVCAPLDEIESLNVDFGAVLDQHMQLSSSTHYYTTKKNIELAGDLKIKELPSENFFNSGVLWIRDTEDNHVFFKQWHENWLASRNRGITSDQPSLYLTNQGTSCKIKEIDGKWNCQVWFAARYLNSAKIVHYFSSMTDFTGEYSKFSVELPMKLKRGECLNESDWLLIENAKGAFPSPNAIICGNDYEIYRSSLCGVLRAVYKRKMIFRLLESILYGIRMLRSRVIQKYFLR